MMYLDYKRIGFGHAPGWHMRLARWFGTPVDGYDAPAYRWFGRTYVFKGAGYWTTG